MKKFLSIFCALITAISLTACNNSDRNDSEEPVSGSSDNISDSSDISSENSGSDNSDMGGEPIDKTGLLPNIDGSTSAIPLDAGLRSGFLGISYAQAKAQVSHTTTHDSFKRLINGEVDLIFSVPISAEQQKAADDAGVTLFMEPVAKEGFVFVVNADNPVNSLTSEQIRRIYSGEITNWSQVGGEDREILAYQRNVDSGSQNYMTVFMGDTPLMKPETEFVEGGMAGIMNAVAVYDNAAGAIGYSVYSYAAQMYADTANVKFIAVDGVAPSKQTMADESYPLLSSTYLIYTDKSPESAKEFTEWALSDEGQTYVLESGYLPINGMEIPEKYFQYEAVGTGAPRPANYKPSQKSSVILLSAGTEDIYEILSAEGTYKVRFLKDKTLQDKINADISQMVSKIKFTKPAESAYWDDEHDKNTKNIGIYAVCRNGYLSITLYTTIKAEEVYDLCFDQIETLTYDLFSGKKIERFSDLFYEGEDFLPLINKQLGNKISAGEYFMNDWGNTQKLDFSGILGEPRIFTIDDIGLENDNPYFSYGCLIEYTSAYEFNESDYLSVVSQYRDMTSIVSSEWVNIVLDFSCDNEWKTKYVIEDGNTYLRFVGSEFHTAEEVGAQDKLWLDLQRRASECIRKTYPRYHAGGKLYYGKTANYYYINYRSAAADDLGPLCFDADTLEIITLDMLVDGDWRQYLGDAMYFDGEKTLNKKTLFAECDTLYPMNLWHNKDTMNIYAFADKELEGVFPVISLDIPLEKINKKYIAADE